MKVYYKKNGIFVEITETVDSVFGNINGFIGGETIATFKVEAEPNENIKNLCMRLYSTNAENNSGSSLNQYFILDNENKELLKSINDSNIKFRCDEQPYDNGVVFITDVLNCDEDVDLPGTYPYKEIEFSITAIVSEKTIENILNTVVKNISIEFIYNE